MRRQDLRPKRTTTAVVIERFQLLAAKLITARGLDYQRHDLSLILRNTDNAAIRHQSAHKTCETHGQVISQSVTLCVCLAEVCTSTTVDRRACLDILLKALREVCLLEGLGLEGGGAAADPQVLHIHTSYQTL